MRKKAQGGHEQARQVVDPDAEDDLSRHRAIDLYDPSVVEEVPDADVHVRHANGGERTD